VRPIELSEILGLGPYESIRPAFRGRVLEEKKRRYVALGANMTAFFENRDSALLQIQEMLRTERITSEAGIAHEVETYNELVPGDHELSVTIFVEYTEQDERDRMLVALAGLESRFYLEVDGRRTFAHPDPRGTDPTRTMAVHYVKFSLDDAAERALRSRQGSFVLGVDHSAYRADTTLSPEALASLARDLAG